MNPRLSSPRDLSHQAVEAEEEEEAELHLLKRNHGTTTDIPSTPAVVIKSDEAGLSPRSFFLRGQSDRKGPGRPRAIDKQKHLDLRICILEDSQTDVLSKTVFKKYPVQELQCPLGLQEADFLDLLRSTFPQLAAQKHFDFFTSDKSRRLHPLRVKTLTPEEIYSGIRLTGAGHSALYIRLKTGEDPQSSSEDLHPVERRDDSPSSSASTSADQTQIHPRLWSPGDSSVRRKPGRPSLHGGTNHHLLRVCVLEDSQSDVLSQNVFQKCPVQELQCPRDLQEADFLDLLRSTFPQLAGHNKPFDVFKSDRSKRLQPLEVKTLTPEEIFRSIRLTGAGYSALYIRLKTGEDPQSSSEDLHPVERRDDSPSSSASTSADQTQIHPRLSSPGDSSVRRKPGRPSLHGGTNHHLLRVCVLENSQSDVLSKNVFQKYPVQKLQCPRDLQEADFLDLLRSTFPQLAGHNKPFEVFKSDWSKRLQPLKVKTLTPEEIFRSMRLTGAGHSALYIRLKTGEEEELHLLQRGAASTDFPSTVQSDEAGLSSSCSVQHVEGDKVDVQSSSSTSQQQDMETEEADDEDAAESQVDSSDDADKDGDEAFNGDDDWKPDPDLQSPKKRKKKESNLSGVKGQLIGSSKTPCKVCGLLYRNLGSLIKHAWSHVEKSQLVCGVCGEQFESVEELKGHLRNYQKSHDCSHCGKSFLTKTSLNSHTTLHTGDRPFKCDVCHKTFGRLSTLCAHRWVHVADKPHKCDICPKAFGLKTQLKAHSMIHTGRDKYHCNICGKSVYDRRSLTRHKATHSVERRYGCELCGKRFKGPAGLKSHEKVHASRDRPYLCHICCKTFVEKSSLKTHMLTHSNDRPFICSICSKGFKSSAKLNVHMRVHTDEAPYSCSECGRCFKHKTYLTNHVRTHLGIKRFVCGVCGKACFRQEHLKVHMRTHNGEKPYKCTVCDKAFTQSHCLKTHKKSHQGEENLFLNASTS
ncbi:zinc finger protein 37-like isoform X2 [Micropterus salmoides]|uniref:zinc finger protein 37-like isoform X2 n=1 Tax=Micropterus salmoides TaxID=27706 RepID=UPI0018EB7284|nr:zinc finger protein 37-like isoform X2 [Micropterus salmoides]XP_038587313.1 zinc finger protein 37-like isoform X2 [Micropterus salmoides]XP_038587314.1 zinc finger protein 37-like isoform X2 [Micropterus salmoides]XP_038587315.1 zinc finger protein 37-like isoform X2 [Micropterus salmoides]XP_038587316.1 zinc finger protein 37-like isoform X2 [Micropterus salmoides]